MDEIDRINDLGRGVQPSTPSRESARAMLLAAIGESQAKTPPRKFGWKKRQGLAVIAAVIVIPGAVAIAGGLGGDVSDNYSSFLTGTGENNGPGRPVEPSDNAPQSFLDPDVDGRVLAANEDYRLFAKRDADGDVTFQMGGAAYTGGGANPWVNEFSGDSVVPLFNGIPNPGDNRLPIAGLVAAGVQRVELRYSSGPPDLISDPDDGYLFLADVGRLEVVNGLTEVDRKPVEVAAFDADGDLLQRVSLDCAGGPVLVVRTDDGRHEGLAPNC